MSNPNDNDNDNDNENETNNENSTNASPSAAGGTEVTTTASAPAPASASASVLPLDWTKLIENAPKGRLPIDVFEIDPDPQETELTIVGTAGQKIRRWVWTCTNTAVPI